MNEIAYQIQPEATLARGMLILDLIEVFKEGYAIKIIPAEEGHTIPYWQSRLQNDIEKQLFSLFLKEEIAFQQKITGQRCDPKTFKIKHFHIPPAQMSASLNMLASTQKLFCKGKQLVIDLLGHVDLYYSALPFKDGQLEVEARLKWGNHDISLQECDAIGPGKTLWFVRGYSLKMIKNSLSWKRVQEFCHGPLIFEGAAKQSFVTELTDEDADTPKLILRDGSIEELKQQMTPYPILILKDRWGACADLWLNYGGHLISYHEPVPLKDSYGKLHFKRQSTIEASWEKDLLETDFIKKNMENSRYYCPMDKVLKSLTFLLEVGWHIQDWKGRRVIKQTSMALQLEEQAQLISVKGHLSYEKHQADVSKILGAFNRREHFIQLSDDEVGLLSQNDASQQSLRTLAQEGELVGDMLKIKKSKIGVLDSLWDGATCSEALINLKNKLQKFSTIEEMPPSPHFNGTLRHYQQKGVNWLAFLHQYGFHGILADEMGLGKTVQILAFLSQLQVKGPHLIVMPTSLLFNWRNEIKTFLPSWSCTIHQGAHRDKTLNELQNFDIILTSYTTLRLDLSLLQELSYSCVILDEAQMIKNAHTQAAKAVCQLSAQLKLCVTGTPVENRLQELWSHFNFLMPDLFGTQESFEAEIQASQVDSRHLALIKKKVAPFLLRRLKQDVVSELPPRIDQVIWIEMPEEQRKIYDQLTANFKKGLLKKVEIDGAGKHRLEILEAILRLRQVCCHPLLVSSLIEEGVPISGKFDALFEDLETIISEGHKVLVYSQFTSMLDLMAKTAKERTWCYGRLDGSTVRREDAINKFQEDPTQQIFFVSLKAGGVGLNLTAADYVYLYDPWWNDAAEEQAINRAHRIGRQEAVIAKRFVMVNSIEEKMMHLKASKRLMIDDLMTTELGSGELTIEDFKYLLN